MVLAATHNTPIIELTTKSKTGDKKVEQVNLAEFIDVKGWKSIGNKLCGKEFVKAKLLPPPPPEDDVEDLDDNEPPTNDDIIEVNVNVPDHIDISTLPIIEQNKDITTISNKSLVCGMFSDQTYSDSILRPAMVLCVPRIPMTYLERGLKFDLETGHICRARQGSHKGQ